jgi:hypothetical protein
MKQHARNIADGGWMVMLMLCRGQNKQPRRKAGRLVRREKERESEEGRDDAESNIRLAQEMGAR